MPDKVLLTDEEIGKATGHYFSSSQHGILEIVHKSNKAQLKKVVEELKERAEVEHEHCDDSCSHRGVSIWFNIYDWQALLDEVKE